jgi:hypothetical protein
LRAAALWAPAAAWGALLLLLGHQGADDLPSGGIWGLPGIDKAAHAAAYGVLGFLGALAAPRRGLLVGPLLAAAVGAIDEWGQRSVPGRFSSALDLLADVTGALLGAWLCFRTVRRRSRSQDPGPSL